MPLTREQVMSLDDETYYWIKDKLIPQISERNWQHHRWLGKVLKHSRRLWGEIDDALVTRITNLQPYQLKELDSLLLDLETLEELENQIRSYEPRA